jgi:hypothetical protein
MTFKEQLKEEYSKVDRFDTPEINELKEVMLNAVREGETHVSWYCVSSLVCRYLKHEELEVKYRDNIETGESWLDITLID